VPDLGEKRRRWGGMGERGRQGCAAPSAAGEMEGRWQRRRAGRERVAAGKRRAGREEAREGSEVGFGASSAPGGYSEGVG
jgi:hypothetical protein